MRTAREEEGRRRRAGAGAVAAVEWTAALLCKGLRATTSLPKTSVESFGGTVVGRAASLTL